MSQKNKVLDILFNAVSKYISRVNDIPTHIFISSPTYKILLHECYSAEVCNSVREYYNKIPNPNPNHYKELNLITHAGYVKVKPTIEEDFLIIGKERTYIDYQSEKILLGAKNESVNLWGQTFKDN